VNNGKVVGTDSLFAAENAGALATQKMVPAVRLKPPYRIAADGL